MPPADGGCRNPSAGGYQPEDDAPTPRTMTRFTLMSRLGLAERLVRLERRVVASNRAAVARESGSTRESSPLRGLAASPSRTAR